jgi:hypothetical protein
MPRFSLDQIRKGISHNLAQEAPRTLTRGEKGVIISILNEVCSGDVTRRLVLAWLFPDTFPDPKTASSKRLTPRQWWGLWKWVEPQKVMKGYWKHRDGLEDEVSEIFIVQMKSTGAAVVEELKEESDG